ncbi:unnamed protein product [Oppiella nova]|uniref:UDP-glycosyltransferase n=1 Tax=Oppiella nova TaxID=334625 RepID=A0A7R9M681_9ACAR|nr:unnamed protein product [Oppiella nova]CAG2170231.1 unnamed protein product [Oppiella nova]
MVAKRLTILVAPMEGVGHVNACIGLAQVLQSRGHRIVFVADQSFEGLLSPYGFTEEILASEEKDKLPGEVMAKVLLESGFLSGASPMEKLKVGQNMKFAEILVNKMRANEPKLQAIVAKYNPDLYVIDDFIGSPTLIHSNKPWVYMFSGNPLFVLRDDKTPPGGSGFATNGDRSDWKAFRELSDKEFSKMNVHYNKWMTDEGLPTVPMDGTLLTSPHLNIYGYPEELDYTDVRPLPDRWLRVDAFMRNGEQEFAIPDKFLDRDPQKSKLIYLSMGSMGSVDVNLMKRFVAILSKSEHKFIVSKGVLGDSYELADNMWGQKSVPQTKVVPIVSLVITHGGNNSVTETFSYGKPMIVMPLFGDQYDNAQRVQEKGFGIRLNPYECTERELLTAIDSLLNDKDMNERLAVASKRMLSSHSIHRVSEVIESLVK